MVFYLAFYFVNILFAFFADLSYSSNKLISKFLLAVIVFSHTFIIGLRDIGVGLDTEVYIESYFFDAISIDNFRDFITSSDNLGYLFLSFLCVQIVPLPQSLIAGTEFVTILFFVMGMWNYRKLYGIKIWILITFFCFMYSMHTLNLMRQSCALAILFYAFSLYLRGKWKTFWILQIAACFFHTSAFFFVIVPLFYYVSSINSNGVRYLFLFSTIIFLCVAIGEYYSIVEVAGNVSSLEKYANDYGVNSQFAASGFSQLGLRSTVNVCIMLPVLLVCKNKGLIENRMFFFMVLLYLTSTIIVQYLPTIMQYAGRIGYYILVVWIPYYAYLISKIKFSPILKVLLLADMFWDWYMGFIVGNGGNVMPFKSTILGIY